MSVHALPEQEGLAEVLAQRNQENLTLKQQVGEQAACLGYTHRQGARHCVVLPLFASMYG